MREIVNKLHENRQIELAKSILESNGYRVAKESKRLNDRRENLEGTIYAKSSNGKILDYYNKGEEILSSGNQ